jgi:thiamine biosynthesis lipoprotein
LEPARSAGAPAIVRRDADVGVDLGGIAKGYGVDRAVEALRDWGVAHALVNVGGDLYALGDSPEGDPWEVGVRSPEDPGRIALRLRVRDRAVATSGDYEQGFDHAGRRYHHILDPRTGAPLEARIHGVTVLADACLTADAAATAAFGLGPGEARALVAGAAPGAEVVHA